MLSSLRKFSGSIFAKILLGIIVIPFVFWGMGSSLTGGNKNIIAVIDKDKLSVDDFVRFVERYSNKDQKINSVQLDNFLSIFIQDRLLQLEIEDYKIQLSDKSLSKLIKNQEEFKKQNVFSRVEYEKFLIKNNMSASSFEANLALQEKKRQLIDIIGGGIIPSDFLVNNYYNKLNHKRFVELIKLDNFFKNEIKFTDDQIKTYYENNKNNYKVLFKTIDIIEIKPNKVTGLEELNEAFFKKVDEIDNLIIQGEDIKLIAEKFNLGNIQNITLNKFGENENFDLINFISKDLTNKIFNIEEEDFSNLIELKNKYYIVKSIGTKFVFKDINNQNLKKTILTDLKRKAKQKFVSEIISKIRQNNFTKSDFDNFSKEKNLLIKKVTFSNRMDDKNLKKELVNEVYSAPKKKVILVHDIDFKEIYLIFVDSIENVTVQENSESYKESLKLSKIELENELLSSYDRFIKKKYKIDVNYKTLDRVKSYFN